MARKRSLDEAARKVADKLLEEAGCRECVAGADAAGTDEAPR